MQPVYQLVTATGNGTPVILNNQAVPFEAIVAVEIGTASAISAQVQYTFDDIEANAAASFSAQAFPPAQVGWTTVWQNAGSALSANGAVSFTSNYAQTAADGTFPGPVRAVRVNFATLTGGNAMVVVMQAENQRAG